MERVKAVGGDWEQIGEFVTDCVSSGSRVMSSLKALMSIHNPTERVVPSHLFALKTGHGIIRQACRIHPAIPLNGIMTSSRLRLTGPTSTKAWIPVNFFFLQHVERGFGQMPRHRSNRFRMSFSHTQPSIELADVPVGASRVIHRR
jgi:hypothetical protein